MEAPKTVFNGCSKDTPERSAYDWNLGKSWDGEASVYTELL